MLCSRCRTSASRVLSAVFSIRASSTIHENARQLTEKEFIVHETPKSTRQPKKALKKRSPELQQKLFDQYLARQQEVKLNNNLATTNNSHVPNLDEVIDDLERWGTKVRGQTMSKKDYTELGDSMSKSFSSTQLYKFLMYHRIPISIYKGKPPKIELILKQLWQIKVLAEVSGTTERLQKALEVPRKTLFFLTLNRGEIIQKWSAMFNARIELDEKASSLVVTAKPRYFGKIEKRIREVSQSINTRKVILRGEDTSTLMKSETMAMLKVYVDPVSVHELELAYNGTEKDFSSALRSIITHLDLRRQARATCFDVDSAAEYFGSRVMSDSPSSVDRSCLWSRSVSNTAGVWLPHYIRHSNDPRPVFGHQVGARTRVQPIDPQALTEHGQNMNDICSRHFNLECGDCNLRTVEVTFGYALSAQVAGSETALHMFSSNVPGLHQLIKTLKPSSQEPTSSNVLTFIQDPSSSSLADILERDFEDGAATSTETAKTSYIEEALQLTIDTQSLKAQDSSIKYVVRKIRHGAHSVLSLPSHHADIRIGALFYLDLQNDHQEIGVRSSFPSIEEFISKNEFDPLTRTYKFPEFVEFEGQSWFLLSHETIDTLTFETPELRPQARRNQHKLTKTEATEVCINSEQERATDPSEAILHAHKTNGTPQMKVEWSRKKSLGNDTTSGPSQQELKLVMSSPDVGDADEGTKQATKRAWINSETGNMHLVDVVVELMRILDRPQ